MTAVTPVKLHFEDSGDWHSLPQWAEYFIAVGRQLAHADRSESRIVTAMVTPTRAFGAAFVSLGMVISDFAARERVSHATHFRTLLDLPPGTTVIYRQSPERTFKGILQGSEEVHGTLYVRVQISSTAGGRRAYLIPESLALQVQPTHHSGTLPNNPSGKNKRFANTFVDQLLGASNLAQLGPCSQPCCTIVGRRNVLEYEIRRTPLLVHANGQHSTGYLQDVLRVDRFAVDHHYHRAALVPVGSGGPPDDLVENTQLGVVFDGAAGFLKWGQLWGGRHQIVVLDRTEPYFDDAISAINSRFSQNRVDGEVPLPTCDAPPGAEVLAFREAVT
ncbi:MAG: hypothetical protein F9K17_12140 [Phycisphaerae bacterium]|nr:MAG: hypothetical protein F9K17_12140 [Phycisphaerae bacterium]